MILSDFATEEREQELTARARNHIFCDCSPTIMFCGVHVPAGVEPDTYEMPDGDECPDCYLVWLGGYCPLCGGHWTEDDYRGDA